MDVSTFELQAKSQNWKKKEKSSVHKQLVDGWKTTEITHYMKTLVGLGANSSPFVASIADVLLSRLVQMRTMPSLAQLKRFRNSQKSD
jgi:hypothetical protein